MFIKTITTNLFQLYCEIIYNAQVIIKGVIYSDENF